MNILRTRNVSHDRRERVIPHAARVGGFTSVELLVVIVVIALLAGMLLPSLARVREKSRIAGCVRNLKQMGQGSLMYSRDFNGNFSGASWNPGKLGINGVTDRNFTDDDLNWLYPRYIDDVKTFICPATQNKIDTTFQTNAAAPYGRYLRDLVDNAFGPTGQGDSYEVYGDYSFEGGCQKKTEREVSVHALRIYTGHIGEHPGPAAAILVGDADDVLRSDPSNQYEAWPEPGNNHGSAGTCLSFCDGHADFIPRNQYLHAWNFSQDSNTIGH